MLRHIPLRPLRVASAALIAGPLWAVSAAAATAAPPTTVSERAFPASATRYQGLLAAREVYARIVAAGEWPMLTGDATLRLGDEDPEIAILRDRLATEGYGQAAAAAPERFDRALAEALSGFQGHHHLPPDGVLGVKTRSALNVSAASRLAQIDVNLERWRAVPHVLPPDRIIVDIAGARAVLFENGRVALRMKAIVGDPRHQTPMFNSKITAVVLNPPWIPPDSIVRKEIRPKAARDAGYLVRNNFIEQGGRLIQRPGPGNSLGQFKFDLPSPYGVYLHDTPGKSAFARADRALSHGCVRLEKPRELAERLLGAQGWTPGQIDLAIAKGATQRVELKSSTALYLFYWTAVADAAGVDFRPDVYGWDRHLKPPSNP